MNKWWFRVPIVLFCVLMIATVVLFSKVAYAGSGMPEFGQILTSATNGLVAYLDWLLEVLKTIW